jgi:hypothetical protein
MSYLTIIAIVWAMCAFCAVLFIRGASVRDGAMSTLNAAEPTLGDADEFGRSAV